MRLYVTRRGLLVVRAKDHAPEGRTRAEIAGGSALARPTWPTDNREGTHGRNLRVLRIQSGDLEARQQSLDARAAYRANRIKNLNASFQRLRTIPRRFSHARF